MRCGLAVCNCDVSHVLWKHRWEAARAFIRALRMPDKSRNRLCVHCRREVFLDPDRPFCIDCYRVWAEYENPDHPERWCHDCGGEHATSMARTLCRACWVETACP